jgi:hypothetical protein
VLVGGEEAEEDGRFEEVVGEGVGEEKYSECTEY